MSAKKVCLLCYVFAGGFRSFTLNLYSLLERKGFEVTLVFLRELSNIPDNLKFTITNPKTREKKHNFRFLFLKAANKLLMITHNDMKHRQSYDMLCSQIKAAKKVDECKPLDLYSYDCVISTEEMFCTYFLSKKVLAKKKIAFIHPDYKAAGFNKKIDRYYFKEIDYLFAVSDSGKVSLENSFPDFKKKTLGMRNSIDYVNILKKSNAYDCGFNRNTFNIITVCRLDNKSKALDRLLRIALSLKKEGYSFVWRIIGSGDYGQTMKEFIFDNNLEQNLIMLGYIDNPMPYIKESDLFVLQSYYEGYPIVIAESLAIGTPSLITDYPSAKEQIKDGVTGFIVQNNFDDIYAKLKYLLNSKTTLSIIRDNLKIINRGDFEDISVLEDVINDK